MKTRYRLTHRGLRGGMYYCVDKKTRKRTSLHTTNEDEARQIVEAKNAAERQPTLNLQIAKAYIAGTDSGIATRTWQHVLNTIIGSKKGSTQVRWQTAANDKALNRWLKPLPKKPYERSKQGPSAPTFILRSRPSTGPLFSKVALRHEKHRAKEFKRRCVGLNIKGVTLHSYRYSWAERARKAGYPERFAMENLGHDSKAVHWAYAKKAQVIVPALEDYELRIVPLNQDKAASQSSAEGTAQTVGA